MIDPNARELPAQYSFSELTQMLVNSPSPSNLDFQTKQEESCGTLHWSNFDFIYFCVHNKLRPHDFWLTVWFLDQMQNKDACNQYLFLVSSHKDTNCFISCFPFAVLVFMISVISQAWMYYSLSIDYLHLIQISIMNIHSWLVLKLIIISLHAKTLSFMRNIALSMQRKRHYTSLFKLFNLHDVLIQHFHTRSVHLEY